MPPLIRYTFLLYRFISTATYCDSTVGTTYVGLTRQYRVLFFTPHPLLSTKIQAHSPEAATVTAATAGTENANIVDIAVTQIDTYPHISGYQRVRVF